MSDIAVRVENLGKMYRIGGKQKTYDTLRDSIADIFSTPFRRARSILSGQAYGAAGLEETIWALKDVSFEVKQGEVVGIIGRNGAGKSTLLKILSRITEPSEGYVDVFGRVGSLLEVGTGFHPELTGRENIYLNGAILGMSREEINRKFDEIVDFSGVEKFIDTPVKFYSSGMGLRLGFAVAAHLEPDILVVDEVLAVGDAEFQKKCLGKMQDVAGEGRTVLFVSHNMAAVQNLCHTVLVLENGTITYTSDSSDAIHFYLSSNREQLLNQTLADRVDRTGDGSLRFTSINFIDQDTNEPIKSLLTGQNIRVEIEYIVENRMLANGIKIGLSFWTMNHQLMFTCSSEATGTHFTNLDIKGTITCYVKKWPLSPGIYFYNILGYTTGITFDWIKEAGYIDVEAGDFYGTGFIPARNHQSVLIDYEWNYEKTTIT